MLNYPTSDGAVECVKTAKNSSAFGTQLFFFFYLFSFLFQVMCFKSEDVATFIAVAGILSVFAQVLELIFLQYGCQGIQLFYSN